MQEVFLCRHGEASFDAPSDKLRTLTEYGVERSKQVASDNEARLSGVTQIWSSDLVRAKQTALFYEQVLRLKAVEKHFLRPEAEPQRVVRELSKLPAETILIVSHMPLLGDLACLLVEGHQYQPYPFQTSELVHLQGELLEAGLCQLMK